MPASPSLDTARPRPTAPRRSAAAAAALLLALAGLAATGGPGSPAAAAGDHCAAAATAGLTVFTWTGGHPTDAWEEPANWAGGQAPTKLDAQTAYVCLDAAGDADPGSAAVELGDGVEARVQAVDVAAGTTLTVGRGGKLFVHGDPATRPSRVRADADLVLAGGTLGGPGTVLLDGRMTWRSLPPAPGQQEGAAATLTSDPCVTFPAEPCTTGDGDPGGRLEVGDTGALVADGEGVNLHGRYTLVVRGRFTLAGRAYVAADRGTRVELRPRAAGSGRGVLDLRNDGGVYEGFDRGRTALAGFVNDGLVLKSGGDGTSVLSADYAQTAAGRVQVRRGVLALPTGAVTPARLAAGASYGTGTCPPLATYGCQPLTTGTDRLWARWTTPGTDRDGVTVSVRELGESARSSTADLQPPVAFHAEGLRRGAVAVLRLQYDASVRAGRTARTVQVWRQARSGGAYARVVTCREGRIPAGARACVDRRASRVLGAGQGPDRVGDLLVVVRTTVTSRWVGR